MKIDNDVGRNLFVATESTTLAVRLSRIWLGLERERPTDSNQSREIADETRRAQQNGHAAKIARGATWTRNKDVSVEDLSVRHPDFSFLSLLPVGLKLLLTIILNLPLFFHHSKHTLLYNDDDRQG
jgi:hypothetical protein